MWNCSYENEFCMQRQRQIHKETRKWPVALLCKVILKSDLGRDIKIAFLVSVYPMTVDVIKKNLLEPIGNRTCKPAPSARKYVWWIIIHPLPMRIREMRNSYCLCVTTETNRMGESKPKLDELKRQLLWRFDLPSDWSTAAWLLRQDQIILVSRALDRRREWGQIKEIKLFRFAQ